MSTLVLLLNYSVSIWQTKATKFNNKLPFDSFDYHLLYNHKVFSLFLLVLT